MKTESFPLSEDAFRRSGFFEQLVEHLPKEKFRPIETTGELVTALFGIPMAASSLDKMPQRLRYLLGSKSK